MILLKFLELFCKYDTFSKKTAQAKVIVLLIHQFFPQYDVKDLNNMTIKLNL